MADLDFKHHVSEIPRGEQLPQSKGPTVKAEISHIPDFQGAVSNYAADTNWMSTIGSTIATRSSNAIATKLGSELGKNPNGELPPSFTDFDKQLAQSYATQAQSTLGLQAQALISKSNLELASQPRIDANMISAAQKSNMQGLEKIFSLAPDSVRPHMEAQFGSVMISQNEQLIERMTREQKTDRIDKMNASAKIYQENAYGSAYNGIGADKNGDSKGGLSALNASISLANSARARGDINESEKQVQIDTAYKSYLSGKYSRLARIAAEEGKLPAFTKSLDEHPPEDVPIRYRDAVYKSILQSIEMRQQLHNRDQQLTIADFHSRLALDPGYVTGSDLITAPANLTPLQAEKLNFDFITAQNKINKQNAGKAMAMRNFSNPDTFSLNSSEDNYGALQELANDRINNASIIGRSLSVPEALMQVAATASGPVKPFIDTLNTKAASGNPVMIQEVAATIDYLNKSGASQKS